MMVGPDLLVAPVFEDGARSRTLYLPGGKSAGWFDYWTQQYYPVARPSPLMRRWIGCRCLCGRSTDPNVRRRDDLANREPSRLALLASAGRLGGHGNDATEALLFEDDGLQTTHAADRHVLHGLRAAAEQGSVDHFADADGRVAICHMTD